MFIWHEGQASIGFQEISLSLLGYILGASTECYSNKDRSISIGCLLWKTASMIDA